jgi:hypothetical protein
MRATGHGRRRVNVRDLPIAGRPVVLVWAKRLWRCPEPACAMGTWSEESDAIGPRAVLTERARAEIARRVGPGEQSVTRSARQPDSSDSHHWRRSPARPSTEPDPTRRRSTASIFPRPAPGRSPRVRPTTTAATTAPAPAWTAAADASRSGGSPTATGRSPSATSTLAPPTPTAPSVAPSHSRTNHPPNTSRSDLTRSTSRCCVDPLRTRPIRAGQDGLCSRPYRSAARPVSGAPNRR